MLVTAGALRAVWTRGFGTMGLKQLQLFVTVAVPSWFPKNGPACGLLAIWRAEDEAMSPPCLAACPHRGLRGRWSHRHDGERGVEEASPSPKGGSPPSTTTWLGGSSTGQSNSSLITFFINRTWNISQKLVKW